MRVKVMDPNGVHTIVNGAEVRVHIEIYRANSIVEAANFLSEYCRDDKAAILNGGYYFVELPKEE